MILSVNKCKYIYITETLKSHIYTVSLIQFEIIYFHIWETAKIFYWRNKYLNETFNFYTSTVIKWLKKILKIKQYDLYHCMNTEVSAERIF